jgi:hypothetical protein
MGPGAGTARQAVSKGSAAVISAIAVAVCSAAPEFIWQGLKVVAAHFSWATVGSAILVALILVFFVEPILVRVRIWLGDGPVPGHRTSRHLAVAAAVGIFIALMSVGLHDAMTAFTSSDEEGQSGIQRAFVVTVAWGAVPFAIMLAWQAASHRFLAIPLGVLAAVSSFVAGWYFDWGLTSTLTTAVPCLAIQFAGYRRALEPRTESSFADYAPTLAVVAVIWLVFAGLYDAVAPLLRGGWPTLYEQGDLAVDIRFYVGWFLGLVLTRPPVSPAPTPTETIA